MSHTTVDSNRQDVLVEIVNAVFYKERAEREAIWPPEGSKEINISVLEGLELSAGDGSFKDGILTKADGTKLKIPHGTEQLTENRKNAAKTTRMTQKTNNRISSEEIR